MRIAIIKLSALGDIIHSMVVLEYIKDKYPGAYIEWIVEDAFSTILQNNPYIDRITKVNLKELKKKKSLKFFKEQVSIIKSLGHFDIVIDLQGLIKSSLVAYFLSSDQKWGFDKNSTRESIATLFYTHKANIDYSANVIDRNCHLVSNALHIDIKKEQILAKSNLLYSKAEIGSYSDYIIFIVGASTENKIYPKERFIELSKLFDKEIYAVWGNKIEEDMAEYLANNSNIKKAPKFNLDELKSFISNSSLVIGGDTGPTHMAWANNIPSITIFGNTPEYRNTYITDINRVIKSDSQVNPLKIDKKDFSIKGIDEKDIYEIAKELL
jgi:heptosyltransferase-1